MQLPKGFSVMMCTWCIGQMSRRKKTHVAQNPAFFAWAVVVFNLKWRCRTVRKCQQSSEIGLRLRAYKQEQERDFASFSCIPIAFSQCWLLHFHWSGFCLHYFLLLTLAVKLILIGSYYSEVFLKPHLLAHFIHQNGICYIYSMAPVVESMGESLVARHFRSDISKTSCDAFRNQVSSIIPGIPMWWSLPLILLVTTIIIFKCDHDVDR